MQALVGSMTDQLGSMERVSVYPNFSTQNDLHEEADEG